MNNFLKITFRNIFKSKLYAGINMAGLAVGLAGFIMILLYLNYELSYDTWDNSLSKVFKISVRTDEDILQQTPAPLATFLKDNSPQIDAATNIAAAGDFEVLLTTGNKKIYQRGGVEADSSFFKVFPYKITRGNISFALDKPNAIVISEEVAKKMFGDADPVGKRIVVFNAFECEVTAVMQLPGKPSHINTQFVYRSPYEKQNQFWENSSYQTYIKTTQVTPVETIERAVDRLYYEERLKKGGAPLTDFRKAGHQAGLFVDALQRIHNFPTYGNSNFKTISVLLLLAALLLLAGAINFSNLSIAASVRRAKEVGVRKVLGSNRKQLLWQFIGEIAVQCLVSLSLAVLLVNLMLPYFNTEFNVKLTFFQSGNILSLSLQVAVCLILVILLSGLYPALFLSRYNITKVLKGDYSRGMKGAAFRNALIVVQFTVSAFFIIGTLVIGNQMHYMQSKDKGFSGGQVLRLATTQKTREMNFDVTRNMLLTIPGVQYVSKTTTVPGDALSDTSSIAYKYAGKEYRMTSVKVSDDYFKTLSVALVRGRLFNNSYADESTRTAVINEAAAKKMGLSNPVGAFISFPYCDSVLVQVIGVVKDFNVSGFENLVQPVVFTVGNKACMFQSGGALLVKLDGGDIQQSIGAIEQAWKKIEPEFPIRYTFLDDNFQQFFASYLRLQKVIGFFGFTAIFIAVMGLFALTAFLISQRTKEIGIRKILGAGIADLGLMLSKDFIRLVVVAVAIAIPVGWWATNQWLQSFAYRINVSAGVFIIAGASVITITLLTISAQAIRAAIANPVKSLRTE